jgi:hypothetical protein
MILRASKGKGCMEKNPWGFSLIPVFQKNNSSILSDKSATDG